MHSSNRHPYLPPPNTPLFLQDPPQLHSSFALGVYVSATPLVRNLTSCVVFVCRGSIFLQRICRNLLCITDYLTSKSRQSENCSGVGASHCRVSHIIIMYRIAQIASFAPMSFRAQKSRYNMICFFYSAKFLYNKCPCFV